MNTVYFASFSRVTCFAAPPCVPKLTLAPALARIPFLRKPCVSYYTQHKEHPLLPRQLVERKLDKVFLSFLTESPPRVGWKTDGKQTVSLF